MKTIKVELTPSSIDKAIKELEMYSKNLQEKANRICERLATLGATGASLGFAGSIYVSDKNFNITVEEADGGYRILANGESVMFLEFGAGVRYGYGHPQADEFGFGPGTYNPTSDNWNSPYGWYYPKAAGGSGHTYGNPPNMPMYNAAKEIRKEVERVAREVFAS